MFWETWKRNYQSTSNPAKRENSGNLRHLGFANEPAYCGCQNNG